jgi:hypothetical protein
MTSLGGGDAMATWSDLFGDELCMTSGGAQHAFPTDEHLAAKEHCLVVVAQEDCPSCPGFLSNLQGLKGDLAAKGVGLVCLYRAETPEEHLRISERYGEVHVPTGFPTPAALIQKKRYLAEMIGKRVPSYVVFDADHHRVVDVTTNTLGPLVSFLKTLGDGTEGAQDQAEGEGDEEQAACEGDECSPDEAAST